MKAIKFVIPAIVILLLGYSCEKTKVEESGPKEINLTQKGKILVDSDNLFGINLFKEVLKSEEPEKNVMISPLSVSLALAMTYNGADGDTKEAMEKTLELSGFTIDEINENYKILIDALASVDPKVLMSIANSIWYKQTFEVEQDFININQNYFSAEVSSLDFNDPDAVTTINNWVADKTNDKITEIIDNIPAEAVMYLINAIYFKGIWKYEFDESDTEEKPFYLSDGTTKDVPMMVQEASFNYLSNDIIQAVEMSYGAGNYSMIILLPQSNKTLDDIIDQLSNETWNNWLSEFYEAEEVHIHLPKFKFEYKNKLNDELINMDMGIAFDPDYADFSKINPAWQLFISKVIHKSFIEVNEEGTEAAAVTAVEISFTSIGDETFIPFYVNQPFIFAIKEKYTNAIIFMGKVMEPEYEE
ncbi:MAG: serpin family protein [Bacteroidales bacterium]|nr:serpin family protein [Bacteroidales bacterium]